MNRSTVYTSPRRSSDGEAISPTKAVASDNETKDVGEDEFVASLPSRFHRLNLLNGGGDYAPTDEDVTETEPGDSPPPQQRPVVGKLEQVPPTPFGNLLPLPELIERLAQVNHDNNDLERKRLSARLPKSRNNTLTIEEMTRILTHINLCEASQTPPRWDLVYGLACGDECPEEYYEDNNNKSSSMRCEQEHASSAFIKRDHDSVFSIELEEEDEVSIPWYDQIEHHHSGVSEESMSLFDLVVQDEDDSSGILLDAVPQSCSSSVTWYEGDQIEELSISSDEDEELRELLYAEALSCDGISEEGVSSERGSTDAEILENVSL